MDQSRYWFEKEGTCLNSHVLSSSFEDSWEEQAFAEDAAGPLGGCIWPPRSYTCSFCTREFRSAQALGGHMNVHRRDRARLKQISSLNNCQKFKPNNTSLGRCVLQNPNEICSTNFDLDHSLFSSSGARPSTFPNNHPFTHSVSQEQQKCTSILSWSKFESRKRFQIHDLGRQDNSYTKDLESNISPNSEKNDHQIKVNFTCNLNTLILRNCETSIFKCKDDADDGLIMIKRRRIDHDARSMSPKDDNMVKDGDASESGLPLKRSPNSTLEYLDLELRLGDRP